MRIFAAKLLGSNVSDFGSVTPSNTVNLTTQAISIAVAGTAGTVSVVKPDGTSVIIPSALLPVGQFVPFPATRINATGTTATEIWVMYQ
ncbi:hypothetical protein H1230_13430 [Paenibacillus sp. 19GGS1-52]|uniref:spike base protein, RCAP_Rcc01079 family n=1 Tax=Paenibacillus sp. 19GGS1-52 TaxID=2758563 RepID=UPI001EFBBC2C|nr:hypothetical protein [Paenibacillus sp. 19GGS1-52]ULO09682.1 hypothetical protein H1230_13430 [Paenibacillus sp. 19GGS1-52]